MSEPAAPAIAKPPARRRISLALQGGGTHGAFTWGVLERLLADDRLEIEAVVGTSAGAMNAAVLVDGLIAGGPAEAQRRLDVFWEGVGNMAAFSPVQPTPIDLMFSAGNMDFSPAWRIADVMQRQSKPPTRVLIHMQVPIHRRGRELQGRL